MTFDLRDPVIVRRILNAASPKNFDYTEEYYLLSLQNSFIITESIRTLTILSISAHDANLYTDLFNGWKVAEATPLAFHRTNNEVVVIFRADWTVQVHSPGKEDVFFVVSKSDVFEQLKAYLQ